MKLAAQVIAALALVAYATPAFPCPAQKSHTTAASQPEQDRSGKQAPAAAKAAKADKEKLARSQKAKGAQPERAASTN